MQERRPSEPIRDEPAGTDPEARSREIRDEMDGRRRDEPMTTNPGPAPVTDSRSTDPRAADARNPMRERERTATTTNDRDSIWPSMGDYRRRFDEIQVQFVEEPEAAVKKAEALLKEAVDRVASSMHERLSSIHGEVGDGKSDTERLRVTMQRLRRMIDSFEQRTAA